MIGKQLSSNVDAVSAKYVSSGWNLIMPPKGTLNDLIAQHPNGRLHFIQVTYQDDARTSGIPNGSFVQNAFSNGAIPIRASVSVQKKPTKTNAPNAAKPNIPKPNIPKPKILLIDANTNTKVIIRAQKKQPNANTKTETPAN